jgi:hypothetical protein
MSVEILAGFKNACASQRTFGRSRRILFGECHGQFVDTAFPVSLRDGTRSISKMMSPGDANIPLHDPEFPLPRIGGSANHLLPSSVERRIPDHTNECISVIRTEGCNCTHEWMILPPLFPLFRQACTTDGRLFGSTRSATSHTRSVRRLIYTHHYKRDCPSYKLQSDERRRRVIGDRVRHR